MLTSWLGSFWTFSICLCNFILSLSALGPPSLCLCQKKKSAVACLNDYCLVALTPVIMKFFERILQRHIKQLTDLNSV